MGSPLITHIRKEKTVHKRHFFFLLILVLLPLSLSSQPAENPSTFCNPLNLNYRFMVDAVDARESADPVIILYKNDYYLFASRAGGYWTSPDLRDWTFIAPTGLNVEGYAPTAVVMRDTLFYTHGWGGGTIYIYKTTDPKSGAWIQGQSFQTYGDPNFFYDDDGRLYMCDGLSNVNPMKIVELDPNTFEEIGSSVEVLSSQASIHGWERRGDDNLLDEEPWIEGAWIVKENEKYYYHYAGPGTEFKTYADGIYVADSPLGPYTYADYSPFSFKPTGFICGAGHGSTFKDKDGHYWHVATMTISVNAMFERRLGLWPVAFDQDDQMHCNTAFGDYPSYFPGIKANPIENNFAGMLLLSHKKQVSASSTVEGHDTGLAVDEDARTYWSAASGRSGEWLLIDLGKQANIEAIQVNFSEHNTIPELVRGFPSSLYQQYRIETSTNGLDFSVLIDKSDNLKDVPHDYIELAQPTGVRFVKLINLHTPGEGFFAVRDLRLFGNSDAAVFTDVNVLNIDRSAADGRDVTITWDAVAGADGYIVQYGIAPDKLYNNYMVYDTNSVSMHSLNHGVEYFYKVQAFDSGLDPYQPVGEIRSAQSGNWHDTDTWEQFDGTEWVHPAPAAPAIDDGVTTIQDGHTITVAVSDSMDQLKIAEGGQLVVNAGIHLKIKNGIAVDLHVEGVFRNSGSIESEENAEILFSNNGRHEHQQNGGSIPTASWGTGSWCVLTHVEDTAPSNGNQNFHNIEWNCPLQTGNLSMKWNGNTIGGDIRVRSTGDGRWQMCAPTTGNSVTVTILGDIFQSDGQFSSNGTGNGETTVNITQHGDVKVSGGNFAVSRGSQGGTGTTVWTLLGDTLSITNATTQNSNKEGAKFSFAKQDGDQFLLFDNVSYGGGGFPVEVADGASLVMGTSVLEGSGDFVLQMGATLKIASPDGIDGNIQNTGTQMFDPDANYVFNGSESQVTGSLMPAVVRELGIATQGPLTLSNSVTVTERLELADGSLELDGKQLTHGPGARLIYSGSTAQTTTDSELPESNGPDHLVVMNAKSVRLHASRTVNNLTLIGELNLDDHTLTVDSVTQSDEDAFVTMSETGALKIRNIGNTEILFPVGTTRSAPVWIKNAGVADAVSVSAVKETEKAARGGRINVRWIIREETEGGGDYSLRFGWVMSLENRDFRDNRAKQARIFDLDTFTEVGTGDYTMQFDTQPFFISRGGITELGPFGVGLFGETTGVDSGSDMIVKTFSLAQNYPNPFNPSTTIHFVLAEDSKVQLVVYDLLGKQVAILVDARLEAGSHSAEWMPVNMASGIYIVKLKAKDYTQVRKMILQK